ncbi:MAG: NAD(P)/FAD-dependent oxidoreductase [Bacteroidota bacterium]
MSKRIDIIGGGAGGLACAYTLAKSAEPLELHVWEAADHLGGLAGSFSTEGFRVEKFYHHIFKRDVAIQALIEEMGLESALKWQPAGTGSYYFSQPYRLSSPVDLLRFKPLPFWSRLRMGLLVLHARMIRDWQSLDKESVASYIQRIAGKKVYEIVWEPLLKGKFGPYADEVSAAWLWSKLVDRGGSRTAGGFELLGYLQGGMGRLFEAVGSFLTQEGHEIHLHSPVEKLLIQDGQIAGIQTAEGQWKSDAVVVATQLPTFVDLLPDVLADYKAQLNRIGFLGNVCLVMTLSRTLSEFYWTNVTDPTAPFVGVVEQTNWASSSEFDDQHLVYLSAYVPPGDHRMDMDAAELSQLYLPHIQKMFPHFKQTDILHRWLWKAPYAQPVVTKGYSDLIPDMRSPIENLYLCTMAQIYPNDRQVSNGIEQGQRVAHMILETTD